MCLIIKTAYHLNFEPLIAEKDITCYKILFTYEDSGNKKYITPYMQIKVLHNILIADKFETNVSSCKRVNFGIHSFQKSGLALLECKLLNTSLPKYPKTNKYVVKEVVIPKGTKYWVGQNSEYCSEKIIIKDL